MRPEAQRTRWIVPVVLAALLLSIVGLALGAAALVIQLGDNGLSGCAGIAWNAVLDGAALPRGWSIVSNQVFVDSLSTTVAGPVESGGQEPAVFASLTCYGAGAPLALRRAHEGALAAGGADASPAVFGDEAYAVASAVASSTTLFFRRGSLVATVTASAAVNRAVIDQVGGALDAAIARSLAVGAYASPITQPSRPVPPATLKPSSSSATAAPSPTAVVRHDAPDLESLLPRLVGTTTLATESVLGDTALGGGAASQSLMSSLKGFGKAPVDLRIAGAYDPTGALDVHLFAYSVSGIPAVDLGRAVIESQLTNTAANAASAPATVGGDTVTKITFSQGAPVYIYELRNVVFAIQTADASLAATVLGLLK